MTTKLNNKLRAIFSRPKRPENQELEQKSSSITIEQITPKAERYFGKVVSFCIESQAIQMAAVRHIAGKMSVLDLQKEYCPNLQDEPEKKKQFISSMIADFLDKHGGPFTIVNLLIPGSSIVYRTFMLPKLSKDETASAVSFEAQKLIPFSLEDCIYDYRKLISVTKENTTRYKISLHAAQSEQIYGYLDYFEHLPVQPVHIYHTQDLLGQLLLSLKNFDSTQNYTLINIGSQTTEISFYRGTQLEFSHSTQISSSMMGARKTSTNYEYFAESISSEIQNSLDYYSGQFAGDYNPIVYVFGDFAYSDELLALLNEKGSVKLQKFPVEQLQVTADFPDAFKDSLAVCLPSLAGSFNQYQLADLLPKDLKKNIKEKKRLSYIRIAAVFILVALGLSWSGINSKQNQYVSELATLSNQISSFKQSEANHTYNLVKRQILFDQMFINKVQKENSNFSLTLKELSRITPAQVKLLHLDLNSQDTVYNMSVQGVVYGSSIPPEVTLAEFVENLQASGYYQNVQIVRHVKKQTKAGFEVEFFVKMKGLV